jgi:SpoVK/Ycf46/Vps4 family AAA+-type ATPase
MTSISESNIFDSQEPLPSKRLTEQGKTLLGFEKRFQKVSKQLRLLMHLGDLQKWSQKYHGGPTKICGFVASQYPLVIFHGDVGTGKTVAAESIANRLVAEDDKADDSILFKLSTRVRGAGKVGEMGTLINQAFHEVIKSAGGRRRAILIIDEGDSLAAKRSQEHSHHEDKVAVNTLIQNIDDLAKFNGRVIVILCTNRQSVLDPAILRRAAVKEEFIRPSDEDRFDLFNLDLGELNFSKKEISDLVQATGLNKKRNVTWTYSDIRLRLYPAALAKAYPDKKLIIEHFLESANEIEPSPVMEDA